jgi:hypothetical protein
LNEGKVLKRFKEQSGHISDIGRNPMDPNVFIVTTLIGNCRMYDLRVDMAVGTFESESLSPIWIFSVRS